MAASVAGGASGGCWGRSVVRRTDLRARWFPKESGSCRVGVVVSRAQRSRRRERRTEPIVSSPKELPALRPWHSCSRERVVCAVPPSSGSQVWARWAPARFVACLRPLSWYRSPGSGARASRRWCEGSVQHVSRHPRSLEAPSGSATVGFARAAQVRSHRSRSSQHWLPAVSRSVPVGR